LPFAVRCLSGRGRVRQVELLIAGDEQVEVAVTIVIEERAARAPVRAWSGYPRPLRYIGETALAVVAVKDIRPPVGDVEVIETVVVEVGHADAISPSRMRYLGGGCHVFEATIPNIAVQAIGRGTPLKPLEPRAVHEKNVLATIVVVIEEGNSGAIGLNNVLLRRLLSACE